MNLALLAPSYFIWHYAKAPKEMYGVVTNFLWFFYHFFSVSILFRTFFSPWRHLGESYRHGFDVGNFFSTFIVNMLMRIVGIVVRTIVLAMAAFTFIGTVLLGVALFVLWILLPLILVGLLLSALYFFAI